MSEQTIVEHVKKHVSRQDNSWKFIMGRTTLKKSEFLSLLDRDKKFRELIVSLVVNLSVDILNRKARE